MMAIKHPIVMSVRPAERDGRRYIKPVPTKMDGLVEEELATHGIFTSLLRIA